MGYFNIFYKITRIIDMLTRKRNRKAIMIILIILAVVFLYHNKVNAQEDDLTYNQSFMHLRARLNTSGIVQYGSQAINGTWYYWHCNVFPVKEGFTYKGSCETAPSDAPLKVAFVSDLDNVVYQMQLDNGSSLYDTSLVSFIGSYSSTSGFEYTAITDGFLIIGGFQDSANYTWSDNGFKVYTNYNGESNLNTINQDLLRIEDLLKDYLYGDKDYYEGTYSTDSNYAIRTSDHIIYYLSGCKFYQIKVRSGYSYLLNFQNTSGFNAYNINYYLLSNKITPRSGIDISSYLKGNFTLTQQGINEVEYVPDADGYLTFYTNNNTIIFNGFKSTYNEGQENGLYGGLTDINDQTKQQGEQTRETITNTDIPTSEMTIDTSIVDGVSNTDNDNFLTSIINRFQGVISPSATVTTITIPIPKTGKNIVLRSDLLSRHVANTVIGTYITVFWYVVFFIYFFKFAYRVINWIVTGEIIEKPSAFMKYLMEQNAIITASMM